MKKQTVVTLDLEGVLAPEIWIAVAEKTGIPELRRTTREEPDYAKLMRGRISLLDKHGLGLADIQEVIASLPLLPGALEFMRELRGLTQVIILSDTFEEFAKPIMRQLEWPTIFCHRLVIENGRIADFQLRQEHPKRAAVAALRGLHYKVLAAGDSFNDTTMLLEADRGFFFHAPEHIRQQFPQFPAFDDYGELLRAFQDAIAE